MRGIRSLDLKPPNSKKLGRIINESGSRTKIIRIIKGAAEGFF
jgi:hypothetical protein